MASLLLALITGALSALGFAPFNLWPLTLLGFAILLLQIGRARKARHAAAIGWWFGLGHFVLGLDWIAKAFTYQANMPAWLGWIAVVLLSLYLAVFPALAAWAAWGATRATKGGAATLSLFFAAAWTVSEWLRGTLFTGFPWNPASVALIDLPMAKLARFAGTYGLSGLMIASVGFILIFATRPRGALSRDQLLTSRNIPGAIGALALIGLYLAPVLAAAIGRPETPPTPTGPLVHVVQPEIEQDERWTPSLTDRHLARQQALSGMPGSRPRLILWPESGIEDNVAEDPIAAEKLTTILGPQDVLMGGGEYPIRNARGEMTAARNSVFAVTGGGRIVGRYDKAHLVPYGEYLPMRPLLSAIGVSRLVPGDMDFLPGPGPRTLEIPGFGPVGVQICYEMVFSGHVVDEAHRPLFLFNPSNDAWFGRSGPPQHLAQARLRAIEEGIAVARSTPTGISAIVDTDGRVLKSLGPKVMGMMELPMPAPLPPTVFARIGNWAVPLIALLLSGVAFASRRYKESFI